MASPLQERAYLLTVAVEAQHSGHAMAGFQGEGHGVEMLIFDGDQDGLFGRI